MPWPFDLAGPSFLGFYAAFTVAVVVLAAWARRTLEAGTPPRLDLADPFLLAALRGGTDEVLRTALLSLVDRRLLEVRGEEFHPAKGADAGILRRPVERAVFAACARGATGPAVFGDGTSREAAAAFEQALRDRGLVRGRGAGATRLAVAAAAAGLLLAVGGVKIAIGISRDRPVGILVLATPMAALVAAAVVTGPRRTATGGVVLEDARRLYGRLRHGRASLVPGAGSADAALVAALWGPEALAGPGWSPAVKATKPRVATGGSSSDGYVSSCGSSCSSASSCGSSCGGGGGCGGCGGS
jgi:uncharacterized protein (TIGR04222 family)